MAIAMFEVIQRHRSTSVHKTL